MQQRQTHPGGGEGGGGVVAAGHDKRLGEIEHALLAERQYRKQLEDQLIEVREQSPLTALDAVDGAVSEALERSGTAGAVSHLDEKVKECGRLIVRMGTEVRRRCSIRPVDGVCSCCALRSPHLPPAHQQVLTFCLL